MSTFKYLTLSKCTFLAVVVTLGLPPAPCHSALVGLWTFENGSLADSTGNFGELVLYGDAVVTDSSITSGSTILSTGALNLNGNGSGLNAATGWAKTPGTFTAGGGGGVAIGSKTLVSWITMQSLAGTAGSVMTLDAVNVDRFDGIVFAEQQTGRWMNGSNGWARSPSGQFNQAGAVESSTGSLVQLAITYQHLGGTNVEITGYRNGILMGSYTSTSYASWAANQQEVIFGKRYFYIDQNSGAGAVDALIHEARLYDTALSQSDIQGLSMIPEPTTPLLSALAAFLLFARRRRLA